MATELSRTHCTERSSRLASSPILQRTSARSKQIAAREQYQLGDQLAVVIEHADTLTAHRDRPRRFSRASAHGRTCCGRAVVH